MRLRYTPRARADLEAVFDYISVRAPAAGQNVKQRIVQTIGLLADFPELGREHSNLRVLALGVARYPYTICYRVEGDEVWLIHIRDDRRRPLASGEL